MICACSSIFGTIPIYMVPREHQSIRVPRESVWWCWSYARWRWCMCVRVVARVLFRRGTAQCEPRGSRTVYVCVSCVQCAMIHTREFSASIYRASSYIDISDDETRHIYWWWRTWMCWCRRCFAEFIFRISQPSRVRCVDMRDSRVELVAVNGRATQNHHHTIQSRAWYAF